MTAKRPSKSRRPKGNIKDDPAQSARFKEMAREIEADESPDALDAALSQLAASKSRSTSSGT